MREQHSDRHGRLEPAVTFGSDLVVSTVTELIGIPLLALWVAHATRSIKETATTEAAPAALA